MAGPWGAPAARCKAAGRCGANDLDAMAAEHMRLRTILVNKNGYRLYLRS